MDKKDNHHLFRLSELDDYEVANNDPDIRSWPVIGADDKKLGVVNEFIVDKEAEKVRYVDIKAASEFAHAGGERHLIVPIGLVEVGEEGDDTVYLELLDQEKLMNTPVFHGGPVTRDYEHEVREVLHGNGYNRTLEHKEFYHDPFFDDGGLYRRRNRAK
ncbi:PRC-barrel domain-containing protein [Cytophagaceae bacterium ABcell3]|nr:PRC-barrel domain-containing protein [Cytophagaceae bacterium ABcell3]